MTGIIVTLEPGTRTEHANLYTDLIAAHMHDEGAALRVGGHTYPVDVLSSPHREPDTTLPIPAARARATAVLDVYRLALMDMGVSGHAQIVSLITDLLHAADTLPDTNAANVIHEAAACYTADHNTTPADQPTPDGIACRTCGAEGEGNHYADCPEAP